MWSGLEAADRVVSLHQEAAIQAQLCDGRLGHLQPAAL